ncbi:hypothetical protein [Micromonospora avicenniae]
MVRLRTAAASLGTWISVALPGEYDSDDDLLNDEAIAPRTVPAIDG